MRFNGDTVVLPRTGLCASPGMLRAMILGRVQVAGTMLTSANAADGAPLLRVTDAWIRWLPASLPAAGYATLANLNDQPVTLVGASTRDSASTMFHVSRNQHGRQSMAQVDTILIKAHATIGLTPGGYHLMLIDPQKAIQPGDQVPVTLHFAAGQSLQVQFEVRKADGTRVDRLANSNAR
jgi:periplasmic copper chaperone A